MQFHFQNLEIARFFKTPIYVEIVFCQCIFMKKGITKIQPDRSFRSGDESCLVRKTKWRLAGRQSIFEHISLEVFSCFDIINYILEQGHYYTLCVCSLHQRLSLYKLAVETC